MLVNDVNGERVGASMVKNSAFYIEVAKFVQAYTTIINNPNEFLREVGLPLIDEEKDMLNWNQFVKIVQNCDLGFNEVPTTTELVVYYNYALEIGSFDSSVKRLASVDDVADAQKHYYNFVDEAADRAESEYLKYHKVSQAREREAAIADNRLSGLKAVNIVAFMFMMVGVIFSALGIVSIIKENDFANAVGSIIPVWERHYVGGILLFVFGIILFAIFDKIYISSKKKYLSLKVATSMIFKRSDETYKQESILKKKLDKVQKDLRVVQEELADKNKTFDVKHNIELLKAANKYYQKLCELDDEYAQSNGNAKSFSGSDDRAMTDDEFAPVKLTKDQEENLHTVSREAINLEGVFDEDAYNEKFEKSSKNGSVEKQENQEKQEEHEEKQEHDENEQKIETQKEQEQKRQEDIERERQKELEEEKRKQEEQKRQEELAQDQDLLDSIDYIKDILGFGFDEGSKQNEK
jgi:hypothetical protein